MNKTALPLIILLSIIGILITGCSQFGYVMGTGPVVTTSFDYNNFTDVEVSNSFKFDVSQSETYSVLASTHQNVVEYLDISKSGSTLVVRLKSGHFTSPEPEITVTMPRLNRLEVSGASKGKVRNFNSSEPLNLITSGASQVNLDLSSGATGVEVSGASKIYGNLKSAATQMTVSGASHCEISGSAEQVKLNVSGASQVVSPDFHTQNADVNLSGASTATVNTSGTLNLDISGASTLNYLGNPILSKVNVTGASKLNAK